MQFYTGNLLTAITVFLAFTTASPIGFEDSVPDALVKRACPADCNNQYPLARKAGQACGGTCDTTYSAGSETCSCNLGAILLCKNNIWQIVADCGKTGQVCFNNQPNNPAGGRTCNHA